MYQEQANATNSQGKGQSVDAKPENDPEIGIIKDFNMALITALHDVTFLK